jgi:hypothetical protein
MKLYELLSGKFSSDNPELSKLLATMPEPPESIKKLMLSGLSGIAAAAAAGEPCPICNEVHGVKSQTTDDPQGYDASSGEPAEFEYTPKIMRAIQFLPGNVPSVMEFLFDHGIAFGYAITRNGESRILLLTAGQEVDLDDELAYGRWAVVTGSREDDSLSYTVYEDAAFRRAFQSTVRGFTPAPTIGFDEGEADDLLARAEQDALDAHGGDE